MTQMKNTQAVTSKYIQTYNDQVRSTLCYNIEQSTVGISETRLAIAGKPRMMINILSEWGDEKQASIFSMTYLLTSQCCRNQVLCLCVLRIWPRFLGGGGGGGGRVSIFFN